MSLSDETLMAFADGELDAAASERVERALREDPALAKRVERHRALRARLEGAFAAELQEPVPERLLAAARKVTQAPPAAVIDLQSAREARLPKPAQPARSVRTPLALAASVLLGVGLGFALFKGGDAPLMRTAGGVLVAQGELDRALSTQLASAQPAASTVHVGLSYLAKAGDYCRSFALSGADGTAGIACRHQARWQINALVQQPAKESPEYRAAATELPPLLRESIEANIKGDVLDAAGEAAAQARGWQ
jgi:negative regulator of sigma E activity